MEKELRAVLLSIALLLPAVSQAAMWEFGGPIDDVQAGTVAPLANGSGALFFNTTTGVFEWMVAFSGLSGPATAAHIHEDPGGGDLFSLGAPHFPIGGSGATGMYTGSTVISAAMFDALTNNQTLTPGDATDWYINIHTAANVGGEIRGQLIVTSAPAVVPLPGAAWLMIGALGTLVGLRRTA